MSKTLNVAEIMKASSMLPKAEEPGQVAKRIVNTFETTINEQYGIVAAGVEPCDTKLNEYTFIVVMYRSPGGQIFLEWELRP